MVTATPRRSSSSQEPKSLENQIASLMERRKDDILPCFSTSLQKLLALDPEADGSLEALTEIILNDYGLMNKVLQTVNSFYYKRFGKEITTISHAVLLLGFDTIKAIATGMAVMSILDEHGNHQAARLMAQAFISAHLAANLATSASKGFKEEQVFIGALLRHLPRLIISVLDPDLYRRLEDLEKEGDTSTLRRCIRKVGYRLKELWTVPGSLAGNFEACASISSSLDPALRALARHSSLLAEAVIARKDPAQAMEALVRDFELDQELIKKELSGAVKRTLKSIPEIRHALGGARDGAGQQSEEPSVDGVGTAHGTGVGEMKEGSGDTDLHLQAGQDEAKELENLYLELIQNLMAAVNDLSVSLPQIFLMAIEIIRRVLPVNNVLLCMMKPRHGGMVARFGTGEHAGLLKRSVNELQHLGNTPIGTAFSRNFEIRTTWREIFGPEVAERTGQETACVVMPIVINGRAIGCLIMDAKSGRNLDEPSVQKISMIRQLLITAVKLRAGIRS